MPSVSDVLRSPSFWVGTALLVILLLLGLIVIVWTRRWSVQMRSGPVTPETHLEHYRQLRDQGELSEQEFEQICRMLAEREEPKAKG